MRAHRGPLACAPLRCGNLSGTRVWEPIKVRSASVCVCVCLWHIGFSGEGEIYRFRNVPSAFNVCTHSLFGCTKCECETYRPRWAYRTARLCNSAPTFPPTLASGRDACPPGVSAFPWGTATSRRDDRSKCWRFFVCACVCVFVVVEKVSEVEGEGVRGFGLSDGSRM